MGIVLPIVYLAMIHISGNHLALIPDIVGIIGKDRSFSTIVLSIVIGILLAAVITWIGIMTGQDLVIATKKYCGERGKKVMALTLLSVSIPASSLTGCYYAGGMLQMLTDLPYGLVTLFSLGLFSFFAIGYNRELLVLSNYIGLLVLPLIFLMFCVYQIPWYPIFFQWENINWSLVFALTGYNIGGMWLALLMEVTIYLSQKGRLAILIVMLGKVVEGLITLCVAYLVLAVGAQGPLALIAVVSPMGGVGILCNIVLFCTFLNTMAPAMLLNVRQMSSLTGLAFWPSLFVVVLLIYGIGFMPFFLILRVMSYTGFFMILFILYIVYFLHRYGVNQKY